MTVPLALVAALQAPSPALLWGLRGDLLAQGIDPDHRAMAILSAFYTFLDRLETASASRDLSELASRMDIAALGGVVGNDLREAEEPAELARRALTAVLSEGLAVPGSCTGSCGAGRPAAGPSSRPTSAANCSTACLPRWPAKPSVAPTVRSSTGACSSSCWSTRSPTRPDAGQRSPDRRDFCSAQRIRKRSSFSSRASWKQGLKRVSPKEPDHGMHSGSQPQS